MALTRAVSDFKDSVKAATTTNVTLSGGAPSTVDGVTLSVADSILVKSQTDPSQNGLYRVTTLGTDSNGTWTRRADFNDFRQVTSGALVFIEQGTSNGNVFYYLQGGLGTVTLDSTPINFGNLTSDISLTIRNSPLYSNSNAAAYLPVYSGNVNAGNITGLVGGIYWSNGTVFSSGGGTTYSNSNVASYLPTYSGTLTAGTITTTSGGQVTGYLTGVIGANTANTGAFTTVTASGITTLTNATDSTNSSSGGLIVSGGLGVAKNTFIGGNLTVVGNLAVQGLSTTIGSTDLTVNDSVINLHTYPNLASWTVNDGRDIGFKLHYFDATLASGDNLAFLGRVNTSGFLEYYTTGIENSSNVFTSGTYGTVKTGELVAANSTVSTSTTTGALRVSGGTGIVGNLYVGGGINGIIGNGTAAAGTFTTLTATSGYQGAASGPLNGTLGATTPNSVVATSVTTTSGGQVTGYHTGAIGANTANTGAFTTITTTGNITATGYLIPSANVTYDLGTPTARWRTLYLSGNTIDLGGTILSGDTAGSLNNGSLNATAVNGATIGNSGAIISGASQTLTGASQAASYITSSGGQVTGYHTGAIGANTANTGVFTSVTTTSGGQVTGYLTGAIGANTANTGAFTTITSTSTIIASGNIVASSGTASTNQTTGALVVRGGIGANGTANVGNVITTSGIYWANGSAYSGVKFTTATTPPAGNLVGDYWYNSSTDTLYQYVNDSVSSFWYDYSSMPGTLYGYINGAVGANTPNTVVATSVTITSGGQVTGYLTGAIGANTANTGAFTNVTANGRVGFTYSGNTTSVAYTYYNATTNSLDTVFG